MTQTVASTGSPSPTSTSQSFTAIAQSAATQRQQAILDEIGEQFPKADEADRRSIFKAALGADLQKLPPHRAVWLATVAHIRHRYTEYDTLLPLYGWRKANTAVTSDINRKLLEWGSRRTTNIRPDNRAEFLKDVIAPNVGKLDRARKLQFEVQTAEMAKNFPALEPLLLELTAVNADLGKMLLYYGLAHENFGPDMSAAREQKEIEDLLSRCESTLHMGREALARHGMTNETPGIFYEKQRGDEAGGAESSRLYDRLTADAEARRAEEKPAQMQENEKAGGARQAAAAREPGGGAPKQPHGKPRPKKADDWGRGNPNHVVLPKPKLIPEVKKNSQLHAESVKKKTTLPRPTKEKTQGNQSQPAKKWTRSHGRHGSNAPASISPFFGVGKEREPGPFTLPSGTSNLARPAQQEKEQPSEEKTAQAKQPGPSNQAVPTIRISTGDAGFRASKEYIVSKIASGKGKFVSDANIDKILNIHISRGFGEIRKVLIQAKYIAPDISIERMKDKFGDACFGHLISIIGDYVSEISETHSPAAISELVEDCFVSYCCRKTLISAFQAVVGGDKSKRDEVVKLLIAAMKMAEALGSSCQSIYNTWLEAQPVDTIYFRDALARNISENVALQMANLLNVVTQKKTKFEYNAKLHNILENCRGSYSEVLSGLKKNFGFHLGMDAEALVHIASSGNHQFAEPKIVNELKAFYEIREIIILSVKSAKDKSLANIGISNSFTTNMASEKMYARAAELGEYIDRMSVGGELGPEKISALAVTVGKIVEEILTVVDTFDGFITNNTRFADALVRNATNLPTVSSESSLSERSARDIIKLIQLPVFSEAAFFEIGFGLGEEVTSTPSHPYSDKDIDRIFAMLVSPWQVRPPQAHIDLLAQYFRGRMLGDPEMLHTLILQAGDAETDGDANDIGEVLEYVAYCLRRFD